MQKMLVIIDILFPVHLLGYVWISTLINTLFLFQREKTK